MGTRKVAHESGSKSLALERVLQCYVIASVFSTSGVDVLLVVTVVFLLFAFLRQSALLRGTGFRGLARNAVPGPRISLCEAVRPAPVPVLVRPQPRN